MCVGNWEDTAQRGRMKKAQGDGIKEMEKGVHDTSRALVVYRGGVSIPPLFPTKSFEYL